MSCVRRLLSRSSGIVLAMLLLLLAASTGMVMAQESSDTGDMSITVLPAGSPAPAPGETPDPPGKPGEPMLPGNSSAPDAPGEVPVGLGTVSAWVVYYEPVPGFPEWDEPPTLLVVRDDRGTARGWSVTLSASGPDDTEWSPFLLENRTSTIVRILPPTDVVPAGGEQVTGGRTLGPLPPPLLALKAEPGSGAGVYVQELRVAYPEASVRPAGTIYVEIPCAP